MHAASLLELKGEDDIKRGQPLFGLPPFGLNLIGLTMMPARYFYTGAVVKIMQCRITAGVKR